LGVRSNEGWRSQLDKAIQDVYTSTMKAKGVEEQPAAALFDVPCACQNLRRATRVVTRIYDQELRRTGLEITQFGLLTALAKVGEANQKRLSAGFAMDSTTLTRTLRLLLKQGWVRARRGKDRRERLFSLTAAGRQQTAMAQPYWEQAEQRLRRELGDAGWKSMKQTVSRVTEAAMAV
jgi:DNA-binding MarR family transcriptional regulator